MTPQPPETRLIILSSMDASFQAGFFEKAVIRFYRLYLGRLQFADFIPDLMMPNPGNGKSPL